MILVLSQDKSSTFVLRKFLCKKQIPSHYSLIVTPLPNRSNDVTFIR